MKVVDIRRTIPVHKTRKPDKRTKKPTHIVVHCTDSDNQDPNRTALVHVTPSPDNHVSKKGAPTIAYSDFITKNGIVYHCVDYSNITFHAQSYNSRSIGIALAYKADKAPLNIQYNASIKYLSALCLYFKIVPSNVLGHREVPGMYTIFGNGSKRFIKECPGRFIDLDKMRCDLVGRIQCRLKLEGLYQGRLDYIFGPKTYNALMEFNPLQNKYIKGKKNV